MPTDLLARLYPPRATHPALYKGSYGRVLIIGGSERYVGALAFNILGALRTGADLAYAVAPRRAADIAATHAPGVIAIPYDHAYPDLKARRAIAELAKTCDALVIGGGMDRSPESHAAIRGIVAETAPLPVVLDAEGVLAYTGALGALRGRRALLTPHPGEYARVTGGERLEGPCSKWADLVRARAKRESVTFLVKAECDVATDGAALTIGAAKSAYMTKGGYGDILAGAAGALLARGDARDRAVTRGAPTAPVGVTPLEAGAAAAELVHLSAARAAASLGDATLASDALRELAHVVADLGRA